MKLRNKNYFLWLLDRIKMDGVDLDEHMDLLRFLYEYEFTWLIENDANRASKGLSLRYEYNKNWDPGDIPCSVLEMLIALAHDWEHEITYDFQKGDRTAQWFWTMLGNLGLLEPNVEKNDKIVSHLVGTWLGREFDENGVGSPFPRHDAEKNQKEVEIWMQLQGYVLENVEI